MLPTNTTIIYYGLPQESNYYLQFHFYVHIIHSTDSIQCVLVQHLCHYISYCPPVLYIIKFTSLVYCPRRTACISASGTTPAPELAAVM